MNVSRWIRIACHFGSVLPDDSDGTAHIYPRCLAGTPWVLGKGEGRKPNKKHAAALQNHPLVGERLGEQSSKQRSRRPLGRDECFSNDVGVSVTSAMRVSTLYWLLPFLRDSAGARGESGAVVVVQNFLTNTHYLHSLLIRHHLFQSPL